MTTTPNTSAQALPTAPGLSALVFSQTDGFMTKSESRAAILEPQNRQIMKPGKISQFVPYYQHSRNYFLIHN
jgi:hypothetical protein